MLDNLPEILDEVSITAPWELVEAFSRFPRWKPEDVNASADMIAERLAKHGVAVTMHEPTLYLSIPYAASVTVAGRTMRAKPPAFSRSVPDGIAGELVYVPAVYSKKIGTLFDKNQDENASKPDRLRGKIVISEGFAFPHKVLEFERAGAIGVIAVNPGIDIHWGICTSIWGTPDLDDAPREPTIAVAAVNNPDGNELIALAKKGGAQVTVKTHLDKGWFKQKLPVVEIRGSEEPEKFVLLHGHYDSWDVGVGDNATGDATLLEVARVLWRHRGKLRRSVRIAWWPGHSTGRYAGSTWFADAFAIDLDENCVVHMNCDSPGCRWATEFKDISWMAETEAFGQQIVKEVTGLAAHGERPHRAGDWAFNNIGISGLFMLSSTMTDAQREEKGYYTVGGCGGNIAWHTEGDTIEIADRDIMVRDIKVYLGAVVAAANARILPLDWRATCREFGETVARYQQAAGDRFELAPARRAVAALAAQLETLYGAIAAGTVAPARANAAILRLARILVPLNFTREARFRHDPALPVPALPTLATATELTGYSGSMLGFAKTQLMRGQNRVVAALHEAGRIVEAALG